MTFTTRWPQWRALRHGVLALGLAACKESPPPSITIAAADSTLTVGGVADSTRIRVSAAGDTTRSAGRFLLRGTSVVFVPSVPFDPGRDYEVRVAMPDGPDWVHGFRLPGGR